MIARNHVLFAGLSWLGGVELAVRVGVMTAPAPAMYALGATVTMAAGIAPDIDHPDATVAHAFGVVGKAVATGVNKVSGGHRHGTHTIWAAIACGALAWATRLGRSPWPYVITVAVLAYLAALVLARTFHLRNKPAFAVGGAAGAGYLAYKLVPNGNWFVIAVVGGVIAHILADTLTVQGTRPFAPVWKQRMVIPLLRTAGTAEKILTPIMATVLLFVVGTRAHEFLSGVS